MGEGNGKPLQCSCLENSRDGEAWWAAVSGVGQSRTRLKRLSSSSSSLSQCTFCYNRGTYTSITEKAMAPHSSTLAWKIPWMEEAGGLQSMGSLRVGPDWATSLSLFTFMHWRKKWQPTPVFLPGEPQGRGSLGGLPSMGSHRVRHDWSDLAAAAAAFHKLLCSTYFLNPLYSLCFFPG